MLKKRIICLLTLSHGQLVRTKNFRPDRWYTLDFVDLSAFDECVCINLTPEDRETFRIAVEKVSDTAAIPITVGGGISSVDDVSWCLNELPAEKVVVETHAGEWLHDACVKFGKQAIVLGVTIARPGNRFHAWDCFGEVLMQSVDHDGSLEGYDSRGFILVDAPVPLLVASGCGTWTHMKEAFEAGADGAATSCIFHFSRQAVEGFKRNLAEHGVEVRP